MMRKKTMSSFMMLMLIFGSVAPFVNAEMFSGSSGSFDGATNTWQASNPTLDGYYKGAIDDYWPILNQLEKDQCDAMTSDFIVAIPVGGCSPSIVRSDLLAEQNVPVFCQLSAIKVNPLIDVSTIKSISFKGDYPEEVAGISFHPARAAISSTQTLLGDPIEQNIGYVVIVLKKQPDEASLEEYVSGMLTATVKYDAQTAFGTGAGAYYLETMPDSEWNEKAPYSSFWAGKGYLRATKIDENYAMIDILTSKDRVLKSVTLKEGETSEPVYYPGQYCTTSMQLKLNKVDNSEDMARLNIDGDSLWVRKGEKLFDGKCIVKNISIFENDGGEVELSCSGSSSFKLTLGGTESVSGGDISFRYGEYEYTAVSSVRVIRPGRYYEKDGNYWRWFNEDDDVSGVVDSVVEKDFYDLANAAVASLGVGGGISTGKYSENSYIPKYANLAEDATLDLVGDYPFESKGTDEYWGEESLYDQIFLAGEIEDSESQLELIDIFLEKYPGSSSVGYLQDLRVNLQKYNFAGSSQNVALNNKNYNIRVDGFSKGGGASDSVNVRFDGRSLVSLNRDKVYDGNWEEITDADEQGSVVPRLKVTSISGAGARFNYVWRDSDGKVVNNSFSIENGQFHNVGGLEILAVDTNIREAAHVSLIPNIENTKAEANFTFNIGIEKRAIELTPEKALEKIENLNKSIEAWEDKIESLGKLIKGMKAACFGVSSVLTLKNMLAGFGGEALARGDVMDVYEKKCRSEGASTSAELHKCYSKYNEEIEDSINSYAAAVQSVNEKVKCASVDSAVENGFFGSKVINSKEYVDELSRCAGLSDSWEYELQGVTIEKGNLTDARDYQAVLLREEACKNSGSDACEIATEQMEGSLMNNVDRINSARTKKVSKDVVGISVPVAVNPNRQAVPQQAVSAKGSRISGVSEANYLAQVYNPSNSNERYYVELTKSLEIVNVYDITGGNINAEEPLKNKIAQDNNFHISRGDSCANPMTKPYVRYYETGNQQGFAAVVPFDVRSGWYTYVDDKNYDESGEAGAFWICNVGDDGIISDGPDRGDICVRFSVNIGPNVPFTPCPEKSSDQVRALYSKAEAAIREANRDGNGILVDGSYIAKTSPMGTDASELECTDFMSVEDCNLMFNVCDPVICPTSRCDLGGRYPVSDVISTGIIGSIALCLPNFGSPNEGGVVIPVCLSGIHAGLDSYVSILKSHRSCLEQNIATGEYTGICDEISAIYMCEFFWGQISPLLDNLLPTMVSSLYGGVQAKGGAEYLTVQSSFDNLDRSVDYFTSNYAEGAFRAFNLRNTEEVGTTICKRFVGSSFPASADIIDDLLEPESPTQFYAHFSESPYSDATVPSTSHYKVYYHIYAGNDEGVQYKVYLKNPPQTSYYASRQTILVDSGFAGTGVAADKSKDFTAPSGYKELCVNINGRDECGFGKVTSDFGLDYASQLYVEDQASTSGISRTEDCVTTSTSAWGMVDPNLQSGVETSIGGADIATTGITRICASANPEQGVIGGNDIYCEVEDNSDGENPKCAVGYSCVGIGGEIYTGAGVCENADGLRQRSEGKWVDVGYCDNENVRCWLDSSSVKDNLNVYSAVNDVVYADDLVMGSVGLEELDEEYRSVREKLNSIRGKISRLQPGERGVDGSGNIGEAVAEVVRMCDEITVVSDDNTGQGLNSDKAEALALKAEVYRVIVRALMVDAPEIKSVGGKMGKEQIAEVLEDEEEEDGVARIAIDDRGTTSSKVTAAEIKELIECQDVVWGGSKNPATGIAWRTDRHNNPTAFTTDIAKQARLEEYDEYIIGDSFPGVGGETYNTAELIGDSIAITIRVIDDLGFYTNDGSQRRWVHTAMGATKGESDENWGGLSKEQKINVVRTMYYREYGSGSIFEDLGYGKDCGTLEEEAEVTETTWGEIEEGNIISRNNVEYEVYKIKLDTSEDEPYLIIGLRRVDSPDEIFSLRVIPSSSLSDSDYEFVSE